jgi:diphosphomevalonate decarboxylase
LHHLNFSPSLAQLDKNILESAHGTVEWQSPSNIALIKYWGKYGFQLPKNPSLSFTLSQSNTTTKVAYSFRDSNSTQEPIQFYFHGEQQVAFQNKIAAFFHHIKEFFPFIPLMNFTIHSENSFPHSAGIASSASSMSALALCLCSIEQALMGTLSDSELFYHKASFIARIGSGSAGRSVYPGLALWGFHESIKESAQEYAIPFYEHIDPVFLTFRDAILILDSNEKSVSSRAGHALMDGNPFAEARYNQAENHLLTLVETLNTGDLVNFGNIVEEEALSLHALMMTSKPSYLLMKPSTLEAINRLRVWRNKVDIPAYFTLDAGPNLHLLYPHAFAKEVETFIETELLQLCEGRKWIRDFVGKGPIKLN